MAHEAACTGRTADAQAGYRDATAAARRATAARPADDQARRTLVACLTGDGFFTLQADPRAAATMFREAVREVDDLLARPAPAFPSRALAAYTYAAAATFDFIDAKPRDGMAKLKRAASIIAETRPDPTAPAHYQDLFDLTGGLLKMSDAAVLAATRPERAAPLFREAVATFDRLLAVYPKAFQYQMYKLSTLGQEIPVLTRLGRAEEVGQRRSELLALSGEILKVSPSLAIAKQFEGIHRAVALAEQARAGDVAQLADQADRLLSLVGADASAAVTRYNVACALSLGSQHGPPDLREALARKAVRLLVELLDGPLYRGPTNAAHIDNDPDFDPIRGRADFRAFRARLGPAVAPPPRRIR